MQAMNKGLPSIFVSHGSPMIALEPREAGAFMQHLGDVIRRRQGRPAAILVVSAHSLTREPVLLAAPRHEAVYDFGGFDPKLQTLRYDAPGAPALADRVAGLLAAADLPVHRVEEGGLDHGIWTPLRYLFPDADVPVLPLAWPPHWTPGQLFALGRALAPLADEGVLIIGSGSITHNLRRVFAGGGLHTRAGRHAREHRVPRLVRSARRGGRVVAAAGLPPPGAARGPDAPHRRAPAALFRGRWRRGHRGCAAHP